MLYLIIFFFLAFIWILSTRKSPCPSYLSWMLDKENPFARENRSKIIIKRLELDNNMHIADLGCGPGRVSIPIAKILQQKGKLTVVDAQEKMLQKVYAKARSLNNIEYLHTSFGKGKLPYNNFDRALLINVLGEIPNPRESLVEILKSLKPNGLLCVTETIFDPHYQSKRKVIEKLTQAGFSLYKSYGSWISFSLIFKRLP